jgi:hypothetical protein
MGQPVEWVLNNVSHLELEGWAKYYEYLADARKRTANKGK